MEPERTGDRLSGEAYNFQHFRTKHLVEDAQRTIHKHGVPPGEFAPDFERLSVGGDPVRLSDWRGKPVLLHFGSYS